MGGGVGRVGTDFILFGFKRLVSFVGSLEDSIEFGMCGDLYGVGGMEVVGERLVIN